MEQIGAPDCKIKSGAIDVVFGNSKVVGDETSSQTKEEPIYDWKDPRNKIATISFGDLFDDTDEICDEVDME